MSTIPGNLAFLNGELLTVDQFEERLNSFEFRLYEVLRVADGVPLFLEDHLQRLFQGAQLLNYSLISRRTEIENAIKKIVTVNSVKTGNVRLLCNPNSEHFSIAIHLVHHNYPPESLYNSGVVLVSYTVERPNPNLKQPSVSNTIGKAIQEEKQRTGAYEILLVDELGNIREGSISNFFLVKENSLYSAPGSQILLGITRKKLVELAKKTGIALVEKELPLSEISYYDAAFICGTSPKLLPVNRINSTVFNPEHRVISTLRMEYSRLINDYVRARQNI